MYLSFSQIAFEKKFLKNTFRSFWKYQRKSWDLVKLQVVGLETLPYLNSFVGILKGFWLKVQNSYFVEPFGDCFCVFHEYISQYSETCYF